MTSTTDLAPKIWQPAATFYLQVSMSCLAFSVLKQAGPRGIPQTPASQPQKTCTNGATRKKNHSIESILARHTSSTTTIIAFLIFLLTGKRVYNSLYFPHQMFCPREALPDHASTPAHLLMDKHGTHHCATTTQPDFCSEFCEKRNGRQTSSTVLLRETFFKFPNSTSRP
eukprot:g23927.t1